MYDARVLRLPMRIRGVLVNTKRKINRKIKSWADHNIT